MGSVEPKSRFKDRRLTTDMVARKLGCSRSHVYNLIRDGRLRAHNFGVRMTRIWKSDFDRFMEDSRIDPMDYYE